MLMLKEFIIYKFKKKQVYLLNIYCVKLLVSIELLIKIYTAYNL